MVNSCRMSCAPFHSIAAPPVQHFTSLLVVKGALQSQASRDDQRCSCVIAKDDAEADSTSGTTPKPRRVSNKAVIVSAALS
jgi:hypothetical protein